MADAPVVGISGGIGAGKTTISTELASRLGWRRTSFGDYVRKVAVQRGLGTDRSALQRTGEDLIEQGWERFVEAVLKSCGWSQGFPLVVDGIRHVEALQTIRHLVAPQPTFLILLELDEGERESRTKSRDGAASAHLAEADSHSTETQVPRELRECADLVLDTRRPVEELVGAVMQHICSDG
ncbi:AAA family ATPase [Myxococcota bacterium]